MNSKLTIALAQLNLTVGDIDHNMTQIIKAAKHARDQLQADIIVFHELTIANYSPEDLLYHQDLYDKVNKALIAIANATYGIDVVVGYPEATGKVDNPLTKTRFNSAAWLRHGKIIANYRKQCLPNYSVFDEKRYFSPGAASVVVSIKGINVGLLICEDLWHSEAMIHAKNAGAQLIISPNASPFAIDKIKRRLQILQRRVSENQLPIVYVNQVGGHDELLFDGGSMVLNAAGEVCCALPYYQEAIDTITVNHNITISKKSLPKPLSKTQQIYQALVLGVHDYVYKNGFTHAVLGLSGGIDSALSLAIAVDALGRENVTAVFMPSCYTAKLSNQCALAEIKALDVKHFIIPIDPMFKSFLEHLKTPFEKRPIDTTEENLQARIRGTLLMAIANKTNSIVLTSSNKSELAVGYATLYGDMAGGFSILKDVYKTLVYSLAHYRNTIAAVIPQAAIDRPPSAELAPFQKDEDHLPPYSILDKILQCYIEQNDSIDEIIAKGFDATVVKKVISLVTHQEYKRRQAPLGTRITSKAFGRDWRYPITFRDAN